METPHKDYQELYLDYVNNFLTVSGFADYYGLSWEVAEQLISTASQLYKNNTGTL